MAQHRHPGLHDRLDGQGDFRPSFHLDRVRMPFLHQAADVLQRLFNAAVIRHKRHIRHDKRMLRPPSHRAAVMDHIVQRHRNRRIVTQHHIAERIADEQHIRAGLFRQLRRRIIVGGNHRNRRTVLLHFFQFHDV